MSEAAARRDASATGPEDGARREDIAGAPRVVVKVGSSSLTRRGGA